MRWHGEAPSCHCQHWGQPPLGPVRRRARHGHRQERSHTPGKSQKPLGRDWKGHGAPPATGSHSGVRGAAVWLGSGWDPPAPPRPNHRHVLESRLLGRGSRSPPNPGRGHRPCARGTWPFPGEGDRHGRALAGGRGFPPGTVGGMAAIRSWEGWDVPGTGAPPVFKSLEQGGDRGRWDPPPRPGHRPPASGQRQPQRGPVRRGAQSRGGSSHPVCPQRWGNHGAPQTHSPSPQKPPQGPGVVVTGRWR